jgi:hypothetical protein
MYEICTVLSTSIGCVRLNNICWAVNYFSSHIYDANVSWRYVNTGIAHVTEPSGGRIRRLNAYNTEAYHWTRPDVV